MDEVLELLNNNTEEAGSWSLQYNEHKVDYQDPVSYVLDRFSHWYDEPDKETVLRGLGIPELSITDSLYDLCWYKRTPIGQHRVMATNIDDLVKGIKEVIEES